MNVARYFRLLPRRLRRNRHCRLHSRVGAENAYMYVCGFVAVSPKNTRHSYMALFMSTLKQCLDDVDSPGAMLLAVKLLSKLFPREFTSFMSTNMRKGSHTAMSSMSMLATSTTVDAATTVAFLVHCRFNVERYLNVKR